jgi:hypothetical protein
VPLALVAPTLIAPVNAAMITTRTPTLTWGTVIGAATYRIQVSTVSTFTTTIVNDSTLTVGAKVVTNANAGTYYWRVNAKNAGGTSAWSTMFYFVQTVGGITTASSHYVPMTIGHNGVLEVYMVNGSRVMNVPYEASATKAQLLNTASKSLAKGYYSYRFRSDDSKIDIVGKLIK